MALFRTLVGVVLALATCSARPQDLRALEAAARAAAGHERVDKLAEVAAAQKNVDAAKGLELADEATTLARHLDYPAGEAAALAAAGDNLNILGRNDAALARYRAALAIAKGLERRDAEAAYWRKVGVAQFDLGRMDDALAAYQDSLRAAEAADATLEIARTSANIGNAYNAIGNLDLAERYQGAAYDAFERADDALGMAGTSLNRAATLRRRAQEAERQGDAALARAFAEQAKASNERALALFEQLEIPRGVAAALNNLAILMREDGKYEQALALEQRALETRRGIGDRVGEVRSLADIGEIHVALGQDDAAATAYTTALGLARDAGNRELQQLLHDHLYRLHARRREHEQALDHYVALTRLREEWESQQVKQRMAELEVKFDSERKQREIERLERDRALGELALQRGMVVRNAVFAVAAVATVALLALWSRFRLRERTRRELERIARTDPLTGTLNRRGFRDRLDALLPRRATLAFVLVDVDSFKAINDRRGHDVGDAVLVAIAERLAAAAPPGTLVARWGGEEFALLLEADADLACAVAERARTQVAASPVAVRDGEIPVTISAGVALFRAEDAVADVVRRADDALFEAKRLGKNRVVSESMPAAA
jgi:diguanylate cyclase (GGDEF)-like protein